MKLMCNVEVRNRLGETFGISVGKKRSQKSCLSVGKLSSGDDELYLVLQTLQNKQGSKYKIKNNIDSVFTKFIDDGKMTIRFKDPPQDLILQGDKIQVKSFAHILKLGCTNKLNATVLTLTELKLQAISKALQSKVSITDPQKYPTLEGFPRTTIELYLSGLNRKSFDRGILRLQNLKILDLSNNQIKSLPKDLGSLTHLQELNLSGNLLGRDNNCKWIWLNDSRISCNLRLLDISSNEIVQMPEQIGNLKSLETLNLRRNCIELLPQSMGRLENLRFLDISENRLYVLPESFKRLKLSTITLNDNHFAGSIGHCAINMKEPTLVSCAARIVLKSRLNFDASIIPFNLVKYLIDAPYCVCGIPCFNRYIRKAVPFDVDRHKFAVSIKFDADNVIMIDGYFCSSACSGITAG